MHVRVYNYNTMDKVKAFEAHTDYIRSIAVHPTLPYLLTCSDDMLIKLWDWDKVSNSDLTTPATSVLPETLYVPLISCFNLVPILRFEYDPTPALLMAHFRHLVVHAQKCLPTPCTCPSCFASMSLLVFSSSTVSLPPCLLACCSITVVQEA